MDAATLPYLHEARNPISDSFRTLSRPLTNVESYNSVVIYVHACVFWRLPDTHFRALSASQGSTQMRVRVSSVLFVLLLFFHRRLLHGAFLHGALLFHRLLHRLGHDVRVWWTLKVISNQSLSEKQKAKTQKTAFNYVYISTHLYFYKPSSGNKAQARLAPLNICRSQTLNQPPHPEVRTMARGGGRLPPLHRELVPLA